MKQRLLIIAGPTAVGKSGFALKLSKFLNMEIISADSVQVYKDLNVGTSKPTEDEKKECTHHLIDIRNFDERFNAFDFVDLATKSIESISAKNKLPVIVGGTGLYVEALLFDYDFDQKKRSSTSKFDFQLYVLNQDRQKLYEKINQRTEKMIENGLVDEIVHLKQKGIEKSCQSMQAIGYKQFFAFLDGEMSFDEATNKMKQETRNYAKRQITWFRHMKDAKWVNVDCDMEKTSNEILENFSEFKKNEC